MLGVCVLRWGGPFLPQPALPALRCSESPPQPGCWHDVSLEQVLGSRGHGGHLCSCRAGASASWGMRLPGDRWPRVQTQRASGFRCVDSAVTAPSAPSRSLSASQRGPLPWRVRLGGWRSRPPRGSVALTLSSWPEPSSLSPPASEGRCASPQALPRWPPGLRLS